MAAVDADGIDHSRFGTGYQTAAQSSGKYVLADDSVRYDAKSGAGGAVPVRGWSGSWPPFGGTSERFGGGESASASGTSAGPGTDRQQAAEVTRPEWMCRSVEQCKPCPMSEIHFPYCQPYGNRVTIECRHIEYVPSASERLQAQQSKADKEKSRPPAQLKRRLHDSFAQARTTLLHSRSRDDDVAEWTAWLGARDQEGRPLLFARHPDDVTGDLEAVYTRSPSSHPLQARQDTYISGEVYRGYQICGRSRSKEGRDYAGFLAINLFLSLVALYVLLLRQRSLARRHHSMLARRIGRT